MTKDETMEEKEERKGGEKSAEVPVGESLPSLQSFTTCSQVRSCLTRSRVGNLGFFDAKRNPRCLKDTTSPGFGSHLLLNCDVPAVATNVTPSGLEEGRKEGEERVRRNMI